MISGPSSKRVLLRAVGPSLIPLGLSPSEALADPLISVRQGTRMVASNDNWRDNIDFSDIAEVAGELGASPLLATDTTSAALLLTLEPGVYSFVVTGAAATAGIVLLEIYDADQSASTFANIATRAYSTDGHGVTIGGFVIGGGEGKQVLIRAVGPTLESRGVARAALLPDPVIELYRGAELIAINDNWATNANANEILTTAQRIGAAPLDTRDALSSALLLKLAPGVYSFTVRNKSAASGIGLVELFDAE